MAKKGGVSIVAVVSALKSEINWKPNSQVAYSRCGIGMRRAMAHIAVLSRSHQLRAIYFVGSAGSLSPSLPTGAIIIPHQVVCAVGSDRRNRPAIDIPDHIDTPLIQKSIGRGVMTRHPLLTVDAPVVSVAERAALHREYGAYAVDMESYGVALAARRHRIPLLVIKYITDSNRSEIHTIRNQFTQCAAVLDRVLSAHMQHCTDTATGARVR